LDYPTPRFLALSGGDEDEQQMARNRAYLPCLAASGAGTPLTRASDIGLPHRQKWKYRLQKKRLVVKLKCLISSLPSIAWISASQLLVTRELRMAIELPYKSTGYK
jgi:hypothetical protein